MNAETILRRLKAQNDPAIMRIGRVWVIFEFPTAHAARGAWEEIEKKGVNVSCWRFSDIDSTRHFVGVFGEDEDRVRPCAVRLRRRRGRQLMAPDLDDPRVVRSLQDRRALLSIKAALAGKTEDRTLLRLPESGAFLWDGGRLEINKKGQG